MIEDLVEIQVMKYVDEGLVDRAKKTQVKRPKTFGYEPKWVGT